MTSVGEINHADFDIGSVARAIIDEQQGASEEAKPSSVPNDLVELFQLFQELGDDVRQLGVVEEGADGFNHVMRCEIAPCVLAYELKGVCGHIIELRR